MTSRTLLALALAGAVLSAPLAVTAEAATPARHHVATARHHAVKHVRATGRTASRAAASRSDNSADALNAQSLSRAQSGQ